MKKKIWIMNHYATNQYLQQGGRHYWFAKHLKKQGYEPTIFCASFCHYTNAIIDLNRKRYSTSAIDGIPFVFLKTRTYQDNGKDRIRNMIDFYRSLMATYETLIKQMGKPDVILASSVHPLTVLAGIKIAHKLGVPCVSEIRDLWPESLVAYDMLKEDSLFAKALYQGEKWLYEKSDAIIMTWQGGAQYIVDRGWEKDIDLHKIHLISNGVIVDDFDHNSEKYQVIDEELTNPDIKKVIYTGSIRYVNNLGLLLDTAKVLLEQGREDIHFYIYGAGNEKDALEKRVGQEQLHNVTFKGYVDKKYVPFILKQATVNILHNSSTSLDKYGQSQNKFFEYLAAGNCIVQTYSTGFSMVDKYQCGISADRQKPEEIAACLIEACDPKTNTLMGKNAREAAFHHDFGYLTDKLIEIVEAI